VTSGPFAGQLPDEGSGLRDLPVVGERPRGKHGVEAGEEKGSEQA